jgi:hypothetical protein
VKRSARILWAVVLAVLVAGVGLSGSAAAPPPSGGPSDLVVPGKPGLSAFERGLVSAYDTENAWDKARFISTANDGWADRIGLIGKVSGTPEERAVAEYIRDALAPYLDEVHIREYITTSWDFRGSELRVVAPEADVAYPSSGYGLCYGSWGRVDAHAYDVLSGSNWADPSHFRPEGNAYSYSFNNTADAIVGDLVWVGRGTAKEFDRAGDVRGKIPLILRDDYVTQWPTAPLFEANRRGALATIFYGYHGEDQDPDSVRGDIVCPGPLPTFQTTANVARHLQALLQGGRVQVSLKGNANIVSDAIARSVYVEGVLWGSTYPDEIVLTGSQIDTWFYGPSNSNGGVATNLELARLFGSMKDTWRPARTLMWVMVGSEELGGPITTWFDWIGGSYNFVKQHPGIGAKIVGELDISNVGYPSASGFSTWDGSWEMQGMFKHAVRDLGYSSSFGMWSGLDPFADIWSYTAVAGGSGIICCSQSGYTSVYHTWNDTFDVQSKVQYERTGKLSALLLYRLAHSLFAPLDMASTLGWVADGLGVVDGLVPDGTRYDAARVAVESLRADWAALRARMTGLEADYRAGRDRPGIEAEARGINGAILEARTHIVNWMVTTGGSMGGWWFYHRGEIHASDLASVDMALDAIQAGSVRAATRALREVFGMDWGHRMSHETYHEVVDDIMADLYWGGEWEQQPSYVDVYDELAAVGEGRWDDARAGLLGDRAGLVAELDHDMEALAHHLGIAHDILGSA